MSNLETSSFVGEIKDFSQIPNLVSKFIAMYQCWKFRFQVNNKVIKFICVSNVKTAFQGCVSEYGFQVRHENFLESRIAFPSSKRCFKVET